MNVPFLKLLKYWSNRTNDLFIHSSQCELLSHQSWLTKMWNIFLIEWIFVLIGIIYIAYMIGVTFVIFLILLELRHLVIGYAMCKIQFPDKRPVFRGAHIKQGTNVLEKRGWNYACAFTAQSWPVHINCPDCRVLHMCWIRFGTTALIISAVQYYYDIPC